MEDVSDDEDGAVPHAGHDSIVTLWTDDGLLVLLTAVATEEAADPVGDSGGPMEPQLLAGCGTDSFDVDGAHWTCMPSKRESYSEVRRWPGNTFDRIPILVHIDLAGGPNSTGATR